MKYLKKLSATLIISAIVLSNTISFAANSAINGTTATTTGFVTTSTITITDAGNGFTATNEITSATITLLDGTAATTTTLTTNPDNSNVATSDLTVATADLVNNTSYVIAFTTAEGDFGTTTLRIGTPTNDIYTVTASVQPVLKFGIETAADSIGVLTTAYQGVTTGLEVGTNAVSGVSITATSANGGLKSTTATHTLGLTTNDALYSDEDYRFTGTLAATPDSAVGAALAGTVATNVDETNLTVTVYTSDMPQNYSTADYDVDFTVEAKIAESTPTASDYTDVITFTATANF